MTYRAIAVLGCVAGLAACTTKVGGEGETGGGSVVLEFRKVAKTEPADGKAHSRPAVSAPADQAAIDKAKADRQRLDMTDPEAVRTAFERLDCSAADPLRGNDDPALPLVTCDPALPAKYVLERSDRKSVV